MSALTALLPLMSTGEEKFLPYQPLSGRPRLLIWRLKDPWVWKSEAWLTDPLSAWSGWGNQPSVPSSNEASEMAASELAASEFASSLAGRAATMMTISSERSVANAPTPTRTRARVERRRGGLSGGLPRSEGDGLAGVAGTFGRMLVGGLGSACSRPSAAVGSAVVRRVCALPAGAVVRCRPRLCGPHGGECGIEHFQQSAGVEVEPGRAELQGLAAHQPGQAVGQLFGTWHPGPIDQDRDDADVAR